MQRNAHGTFLVRKHAVTRRARRQRAVNTVVHALSERHGAVPRHACAGASTRLDLSASHAVASALAALTVSEQRPEVA